MTPEGAVKRDVRARLEHHGLIHVTKAGLGAKPVIEGFFFMPVAGPYSVRGIHDFIGCWRGQFFSLETKAPNEPVDATDAQLLFQAGAAKAGGFSFVGVRDASAVDRLRTLVYERVPHGTAWRYDK